MSDRDPQDPVNPDVHRDPVTPGASTPPVERIPSPGIDTSHQAPSQSKADLGKRAIAFVIDLAVAWVISYVIPTFIGPLLGALYLLLRDGFDFEFMQGRSLGKRLMGLRPIRLGGGKMDLATSASRNWTIALASLASSLGLFGLLITFGLLVLLIIVGGLLQIVEIVLTFVDNEGRRLGDKLANTKVVEEPA